MSTVRIPLTRGLFALIDEADAPTVACHKWCAVRGNGHFYATRRDGKRTLKMHRAITDAPAGLFVDHINGDSLDNRRSNLRVVSQSANAGNRAGAQSNSSTGILGVFRHNRDGKYIVRLKCAGTLHYYGCFGCINTAAVVAYKARLDLFGPIAVARIPMPEGLTA